MITENSSEEAKARYARFWGQLPVLPEQLAAHQAAQRQARYVDGQRSLDTYASAPKPSEYEQKPGQSDVAYVSRLRPLLHHLNENLPPAELERVAGSYNAAVTRIEQGAGPQTGEQLRAALEARQTGNARGLFGSMTAQDRGAMVQARTQVGEGQGALAARVLGTR